VSIGDRQPLLAVRGLTKTFGGARALDGVDLTVFPGELHGLLGENGSGKSTLIKILAGYYAPEAGQLTVNGSAVPMPLPIGRAQTLGLEFVHQNLGLIPNMSVAENLFIGEIARARKSLFVSWSRNERRAREVFNRYGLSIDPSRTIDDIHPVDRALLAIVRALEALRLSPRGSPNLLVLDEVTAYLPAQEIESLFAFLRQTASTGSSVMFVSHDLDEVRQITDRITVLRDGRVAGEVITAETSLTELVRLIVGRDLPKSVPARARRDTDSAAVLVEVRDLKTQSLQQISFDLRVGEILGLTGVSGSGCEEVVYGMFGASQASSGYLRIDGEDLDVSAMSPRIAMKHGIGLVPDDRQRNGGIPGLTAGENLTLLALGDYFEAGVLRRRALDTDARSTMIDFDVRPARPEMEYGAFSGGNQQKAMIAKWQRAAPRLMLLHEPTQGVDVAARQQIWSLIREATTNSAAVCASSDYEQLAAICDRVGVVAGGRLVGFLQGENLTKERIADLCLRSSAGTTKSGSIFGSSADWLGV
jgi:ribose transport system ATP-binding protein